MNIYQRESIEFQPITVSVDGASVLTGVKTCIVSANVRPVVFITAATLNGKIGATIQGLTPGTYDLWVQVTDSYETPVLKCGSFAVS